jgi:hypothetical protein
MMKSRDWLFDEFLRVKSPEMSLSNIINFTDLLRKRKTLASVSSMTVSSSSQIHHIGLAFAGLEVQKLSHNYLKLVSLLTKRLEDFEELTPLTDNDGRGAAIDIPHLQTLMRRL